MVDYATRRLLMVDHQVRPSDVAKYPIIDAMSSVPRELYVPDDLHELAYFGEHIPLGGDRVVLDPRTFSKLLDGLDIGPDEVVLDLGCGLGYSTAVLARMADFVVAVEDDAARAREAQQILSGQGVDNAAVIEGPLPEGAEKSGPYDVIILEGAVELVPDALIEQLRDGGRIGCLFAEGALGVARIGHKIDGGITWRYAFNAAAPILNGFEKHTDFVF